MLLSGDKFRIYPVKRSGDGLLFNCNMDADGF
jgi:hypothetical protein